MEFLYLYSFLVNILFSRNTIIVLHDLISEPSGKLELGYDIPNTSENGISQMKFYTNPMPALTCRPIVISYDSSKYPNKIPQLL